jgi:hypothetical protein
MPQGGERKTILILRHKQDLRGIHLIIVEVLMMIRRSRSERGKMKSLNKKMIDMII